MNAKLFSDAFDVLRTKTSNQLVKFSGMGKKGLIKGKKRGVEKRKKNSPRSKNPPHEITLPVAHPKALLIFCCVHVMIDKSSAKVYWENCTLSVG